MKIPEDPRKKEPLSHITPIPAFRDNYIWALESESAVAVVDPGDAAPVESYLKQSGKKLCAILITHHHWDHTGGAKALAAAHRCPVYGPSVENIPGVTHGLGEGDQVKLAELNLALTIMDIPGHTHGHIAYQGNGMLFCGDTLFAAGCGRLFEGTPAQMHHSLSRLAALPDETKMFCGHEYTLANLAFAATVEPGNAAIHTRREKSEALRAQNLPTLPTTMADEKATNPFLRVAEKSVKEAAEKQTGEKLNDPVSVFAALRSWKDRF